MDNYKFRSIKECSEQELLTLWRGYTAGVVRMVVDSMDMTLLEQKSGRDIPHSTRGLKDMVNVYNKDQFP